MADEYYPVGTKVTPNQDCSSRMPQYVFGKVYDTYDNWRGNPTGHPSVVYSEAYSYLGATFRNFDLVEAVKPPKRKGMR